MSVSNGFHDLLFEMSNENRYEILLILREQSKRITDLTRQMNLTTTEVRRHVTRLTEAGLIQRDIDGYYHLTPYGEASLLLFQEFEFLSSNREYFKTHDPLSIPIRFVKQVGKLRKSIIISNAMDFIRYTQNLLKESEKQVSILVDQFPMNLLPNLVDAIDRGVLIRIIESKNQVLEPDFSKLTSEETRALDRTRTTPLYERRMLENVRLQFFLSESSCVLCFPLNDDQFDYTGFLCEEEASLEWCNEFFDYHWDKATARVIRKPVESVKRGYGASVKDQIIVEGLNDPRIDPQTVQDAVDNYKVIFLRGRFNFGASSVSLSRNVIIRGEGREDNIPLTSIYKKGWSFPFRQFTGVFEVDEDDLDLTIENLNFTDFNCACILQRLNPINSMKVIDNRITVPT